MPRGIDGSRDIKDETIQSVDIKDGTITNDDISASAAIDQTKISNLGGWISNLASGGLTVTNIDTDTGNIDMSIYEPSNPADGDNWMVKNIGTSGNKAFNLPWDVELEDGQLLHFMASEGSFIPNFGIYNTAREKYIEVWNDGGAGDIRSGAYPTATEGDYKVVIEDWDGGGTGQVQTFDVTIDKSNGGINFYSQSWTSSGGSNISYCSFNASGFNISSIGAFAGDGNILKIKKLTDVTDIQTSYPINRGLKPVWELTPTATVSKTVITEFEYDCLYVVEFYLTGTSGIRVTNTIWVGSDLGTDSIYGSDLQSGGTPSTFSRIIYNGSTSSFVANGVGTYSPTIKKIQKFTGFMTVKHDFKRITKQSIFPPSPYLGDECYRDDLDEWYKYNGDVWIQFI